MKKRMQLQRIARSSASNRSWKALAIFGLALMLAPRVGLSLEKGQSIQIGGVVSDADGTPLPEVTVVFEAARRGLSLRGLRMETGKTEEQRAVTNQRGVYSLQWPWDPFYNHFEIRVEMPIRKPDGEHMQILAHSEISDLKAADQPLVVNLTVQQAELLRSLKDFLGHIDTPDERSVYQKMGKPDEVDRDHYPDHEEAAWWYFESGKVYFFHSGNLEEVRTFTPVKPF